MDTQIGILMDSIGFMEGMMEVRGSWKNVTSLVWRKNYACQIDGLREKKEEGGM